MSIIQLTLSTATLVLLLLSGCSQSPKKRAPYQKLSLSAVEKQTFVSKEDLDTLFMQTRYVENHERNPLYITISRRLTQNSQYTLAQILLDKTADMTPDEQEEQLLLLAQQNLNLRRFSHAYRNLQKLQNLPASDTLRYHMLLSWYYYEQGSYSSYLIELDNARQIAATEKPELHDALVQTSWRSLQLAKPEQIQQLSAHPSPMLQSWMTLRSITDPTDNPDVLRSPEMTLAKLKQWHKDNPYHPAGSLLRLDQDENETETLSTNLSARKIGLMLPLTGKHQKAAQAIQKAVFTTYLNHRPRDQVLTIYDSGQDNVHTLYQRAQHQDHADAMIGPLTKAETDELLHGPRLSLPTLTLNRTSYSQPHLTQYSLASAAETQQLVSNMILSGYRHPIILTDTAPSSNDISADFVKQFKASGGMIADDIKLENNYNQGVSQALGTEQSRSRHQFLQGLTSEPVRMVLDKRHDIDSIFIAGELTNARQLIPMLKYHYSGNLPIFSTSSINKSANPHKNQDLGSALFFDIPTSNEIKLSPKRADLAAKIMHQLQASDPSGFFESFRFYGLGVDAYLITQSNYLWKAVDGYLIFGVNGILSKDKQGHVNRELVRMIFRNGIAQRDTRYDSMREHWRQLTHQFLND